MLCVSAGSAKDNVQTGLAMQRNTECSVSVQDPRKTRVLTIYKNHPAGNFMRKQFITDLGFTEVIHGSKITQLH